MCPYTTIYVSACSHICVLIQVYMRLLRLYEGAIEAVLGSVRLRPAIYPVLRRYLGAIRERPLKTCYISRYAELEKQKAAREADLTKTNEGLASRNEVIERQLIELKATYKGAHLTCFTSTKGSHCACVTRGGLSSARRRARVLCLLALLVRILTRLCPEDRAEIEAAFSYKCMRP
jgi:hypothetical protein